MMEKDYDDLTFKIQITEDLTFKIQNEIIITKILE